MSNILLIDNDKMVASGLACLLRGNCVTLAHNMQDMKHLLTKTKFQVAVLDVRMNDTEPDIHFLDVLLKQPFPVLVLTGAATLDELMEYLRKGAMGVIRKEDAPENLRLGVAALVAGQSWIPPELANALRKGVIKQRLTPRQQDILDYFFLEEIPKNSQIAKNEGIAINTVRNYVSVLMLACEVNSRHLIKSKARLLGYAPSGRTITIKR